jgi:hypothetical protein
MQSDRKKILIVASHAKNDEEIKGMAAAIASSKSKDHDVTLITCNTGKLDELKLQSGDYTQVILCAHGRYYGKENLNKPGVGLFDRNKFYDEKKANERHIAEQSFDRVAGFLTNVIINNPNLKNVKLVVCESALNENTKLLKKENQQDNELLLPGSKSTKAIIAPQSIDDNLFEKDRTLKKDAVIDQYSNLEVLIGLITKKYEVSDKVNVKERRVNFQGINADVYLTSKNTR